MRNLNKVLALHAEMLEENPYCYFELAYTRQTEFMVWICTKPKEHDPNRKVLLCGQGSTPDAAAKDALKKYKSEALRGIKG